MYCIQLMLLQNPLWLSLTHYREPLLEIAMGTAPMMKQKRSYQPTHGLLSSPEAVLHTALLTSTIPMISTIWRRWPDKHTKAD
jgi:hypothetical protein